MADTAKKTAGYYMATATVENNGADYIQDTIVKAHTRQQALLAVASKIIDVTRATPADLIRSGRDKTPILDATGANGPVQLDVEDA